VHQLEAHEREQADPPDHQKAIEYRVQQGEDSPSRIRLPVILAATTGTVLPLGRPRVDPP
jgi:hypothetical protein